MILVNPSFKIEAIMMADAPLQLLEKAGRVCYKSEKKITKNSAKKFVEMLNKRGHHSVLEHSAMTVRFICDRGVSHELVRHRLCAFSQESTRYCNYKGGVTFVIPPWCANIEPGEYPISYSSNEPKDQQTWVLAMQEAEDNYLYLLHIGWKPQQARTVLPNSLKTEIIVTANFREWQHIFRLRCSKAAHPQMREIMSPLLSKCKKTIPVIFKDI